MSAERERLRAAGTETGNTLRDRTRSWWIALLTGQVQTAHPLYGPDVKAQIKGQTLTISGKVPARASRRALMAEAEVCRSHGIKTIRDRLRVVAPNSGRPGLLTQTMLAVFTNEEQARFAEDYLKGYLIETPGLAVVIGATDPESARRVLHAILPRSYWPDFEKQLAERLALLAVSVDETEAFSVYTLLEESRSLRTIVLPPEPAANAARMRHELENPGLKRRHSAA